MIYGPNFHLQIYRQQERELLQHLEMQRKLAEAAGSPLPTRAVFTGIRQRLVEAFHRFALAVTHRPVRDGCPCACS